MSGSTAPECTGQVESTAGAEEEEEVDPDSPEARLSKEDRTSLEAVFVAYDRFFSFGLQIRSTIQ